MIDTIVLTLNTSMFYVSNAAMFKPSASWVLSHNRPGGIQSIQNPTKKELINGVYKPRLTLSNRPTQRGLYEPMLKIELSLPKLFFGNNFAELRFKDFLSLTQKLVVVLETMGVVTAVDKLSQAPVAAIHYSKNIKLTDGSTPYYYIKKIKEANVSLALDVNQTDYRNDGHSFKWHANAYEVAFYDKIKDLEKAKTSNKRAIEKDNELQLSLIKSLQKRTKKLEFLRMEVRLNKRAKIKQLFKKLDIKADLTFKKLFKPAISKKVLLYYFDEIEHKRPVLLDYQPSHDKVLLADLIFNNPELSLKKIFELYGFKKALDIVSTRELRMMFARKSDRSWYRLLADVQKVNLPRGQFSLKALREQIVKFEMLKNKLG